MSVRKIAELIPAEYRKEILELEMIDRAVGTVTDATMGYLVTIWKNYVETDFEPDCNLCMGRVLDNFRNMKKELIKMAKEENLLSNI